MEETNEINLLLQKAEDLCRNWPEAWKDFGADNSVCLMARTHQQVCVCVTLCVLKTLFISVRQICDKQADIGADHSRGNHSVQDVLI